MFKSETLFVKVTESKNLARLCHIFSWLEQVTYRHIPCVVGAKKERGGEGRGEKREREKGEAVLSFSPPSPLFFYLHSPPLPYRRLSRRIITIRYNTYLSQTFLSSPYWSVDDFEEKLSRARIEDKDGTVDWFRGQVTFERLEWKRRDKW